MGDLPRLTGLILCGGRARRMDGCDKGLVRWRGRPLIHQVIERLRPQVDRMLISTASTSPDYAALGIPLVPDEIADFAGPLAGIQAGLRQADCDMLLVVPCDGPRLPLTLADRLLTGLESESVWAAVARGARRLHPTFCLIRRAQVLSHTDRFLAGGGRAMRDWVAAMPHRWISFADEEEAFFNVNQIEDLDC